MLEGLRRFGLQGQASYHAGTALWIQPENRFVNLEGELADCTFADASKYFKRREGECATWSKTGTTYNIYTKATASKLGKRKIGVFSSVNAFP